MAYIQGEGRITAMRWYLERMMKVIRERPRGLLGLREVTLRSPG